MNAPSWAFMCGIVGVVRRRAQRAAPEPGSLVEELDRAVGLLGAGRSRLTDRLTDVAAVVEGVDRALRGAPGVRSLLGDPAATLVIEHRVETLTASLDAIEADLDGPVGALLPAAELESVNAALVRARDAVWAVGRDRLRSRPGRGRPRRPRPVGGRVRGLPLHAGRALGDRPARGPRPRLRRARTSSCATTGSTSPSRRSPDCSNAACTTRSSRSGRCASGGRAVAFVYKAAAEIGELGDNARDVADRDPRRRPAAPRARQRRRGAHGARAHALGERRDHLRGERAPARPRRARPRRRGLRRRRVQRRRRQLRRPQV